jgi:hypothetical protein
MCEVNVLSLRKLFKIFDVKDQVYSPFDLNVLHLYNTLFCFSVPRMMRKEQFVTTSLKDYL